MTRPCAQSRLHHSFEEGRKGSITHTHTHTHTLIKTLYSVSVEGRVLTFLVWLYILYTFMLVCGELRSSVREDGRYLMFMLGVVLFVLFVLRCFPHLPSYHHHSQLSLEGEKIACLIYICGSHNTFLSIDRI